MSSIRAASPAPTRSGPVRGLASAALVALSLLGTGVEAQTTPEPGSRWQFLVPGGMVVPTGAQRDAIRRAHLTAAQLSYALHPALAVTATVGWARSRDVASPDEPKLDMFTYDVGAELRGPRFGTGTATTVMPFVGLGGGARSYNYRSLAVDATHNLAAYGSVGGELGWGRFGLRLEARDYVTGFKPLVGEGSAETRNDVAVLVGLSIDW